MIKIDNPFLSGVHGQPLRVLTPEELSMIHVINPLVIKKTITGTFPLSWQDGIGGDLVDYSITGASGGVGDYGGKRNQLVDPSLFRETSTVNGVTFTVDRPSGSITLNGTATARTMFTLDSNFTQKLVLNHYYLCRGFADGSYSTYYIRLVGGYFDCYSEEIKKSTTDWFSEPSVSLFIVVENGTTVENVTVKPQVFDLTAMFPTDTPTDVTTAKARIAEVMGSSEYYPYDSGTDYYKVPMVVTSGACVDLGTLDWYYGRLAGGSNYGFQCSFTGAKGAIGGENANGFCSKYTMKKMDDLYTGTDKSIAIWDYDESSNTIIAVADSNYTDATAFKSAMSGVYLYYQRATDESWYIQHHTSYRNTQLTANQTISMLQDNLPHFTSLPTGYLQMGVDTEVQPSGGSVVYKSRSVSV